MPYFFKLNLNTGITESLSYTTGGQFNNSYARLIPQIKFGAKPIVKIDHKFSCREMLLFSEVKTNLIVLIDNTFSNGAYISIPDLNIRDIHVLPNDETIVEIVVDPRIFLTTTTFDVIVVDAFNSTINSEGILVVDKELDCSIIDCESDSYISSVKINYRKNATFNLALNGELYRNISLSGLNTLLHQNNISLTRG